MEQIKLLTPGKPVPIQIGTEVRLKVQPRLTDGSIFNVEALQDIVIKVAGAKTVYEHTIEDGFISLILPATEIEGVYDVFMEATIDERPVCCAWNDLYSRVRYSNCINYDEYRCDFLVIGSTDEELEAMKRAAEEKKQDYIEAHAEAVAARDAYIAKTETLDGVAKETTSQTILEKVEHITIPDDVARKQDLNPLAKSAELEGLATETQATANKQEILTAIGQIDIPTDDLATKANQQKMMVNFGMADEMPDMQALTDTEIINTYDGYEDEGEHIEGIADTTYGHLVPAEVTIDDEPFTFYQERTYSDYGYSVLYRNGVAIDTTTTHPAENDVLTTSLVES